MSMAGSHGSCAVKQEPYLAGGHGIFVSSRVDFEGVQEAFTGLFYGAHASSDAQDIAQEDHARETAVEGLDVAVLEEGREQETHRGHGEHAVGDDPGQPGLFGGIV